MKKRILSVTLVFIFAFALVSPFTASASAVPQAMEATNVSTRFGSSFAICINGYLWAWGRNDAGQVGDGTYTIWDGKYDGTGVDNNRHSPVRILGNVTAVSAGVLHAAAIRTDGSLWMWGSNEFGQLGDGTGGAWDSKSLTPIRVLEDVAYVSAGGHHTIAIRADGSLWAWGNNQRGQLGDGTTENRTAPVRIMDDVIAVSAGQEHTMAITADGSLWAWGSSRFGNLGNGAHTNAQMASSANPTPIKIMEDVTAVSVGSEHTMAIRTDGSLWAWGMNWQGQLGVGVYGDPGMYGTPMNPDSFRAVPVRILDDVVAVSAGHSHTMAIRADGSLWGWGWGHSGALGDGIRAIRVVPTRITDSVIYMSAGDSMTLFVRDDNTLWASGSNGDGQLGDGTTITRLSPVQIMLPGTTGVLRFSIDSTEYSYNGTLRTIEAAPFIDGDRTMVPIRFIAEAMGADIDWIGETQTITIDKGDIHLQLRIGIPLPDGMGTPVIVGDRTFVPVRYVSEMLGADVRWDGAARAVYVYF